MNLILFKSNELLLLSEEEEEDVKGFGEGGGTDQNDNDEEQQRQDKQKRSSIKKNIYPPPPHHRHEQYKLVLSSNDKRTKHIIYHLKKQSGQDVFVGCINGNKGKAIVQILLLADDDDDDEDNNKEFDNNNTTTDGYDEEEKQQLELKANNNNGKQNKGNNKKHKKSRNSMKKDRRQVQLLLQFHPTAKSSVVTSTTTTLTTSQQLLPSQASSSPMYNITVIIAVSFPKVIKSLLSNVASMGISRIIIIRSQLSNIDFCKTTCLWNKDEYESLIIEGMSQGCHTGFPQININVNSIITESLLNQLLISEKESDVGGEGEGEGEGVVDNNDPYHDHDNDSKDNTDNKTAVKIFLDCGNEEYDPPPILNVLLDKLKNNNNSNSNSNSNSNDDDNNGKIIQKNPPNVVVAIGPERGWTDDEMTMFENVGFISAMIGKSILKVETAAIASLGVICSVLDTYTIS